MAAPVDSEKLKLLHFSLYLSFLYLPFLCSTRKLPDAYTYYTAFWAPDKLRDTNHHFHFPPNRRRFAGLLILIRNVTPRLVHPEGYLSI